MAVKKLIVATLVLITVTLGAQHAMPAGSAGPPLYPDLITLPPADLSLGVVQLSDGRLHNVIRFDNTVANVGAGRLHLEGRKRSKIYQYAYDAPQGGTLVANTFIGNDSVFHKGHNHYHIENFASYILLRRNDATGVWSEMGRGTKTSFCLIDTMRYAGTYNPEFNSCGRSTQGLTVGWADTYDASLIDQWIDLGLSQSGVQPLADGTYKVRSIANPGTGSSPRIIESDYANNANEQGFNIVNGLIVIN